MLSSEPHDRRLPLFHERESAEDDLLEKRLTKCAVAFLQYLPFDQPQTGVIQVFESGFSQDDFHLLPQSVLIASIQLRKLFLITNRHNRE